MKNLIYILFCLTAVACNPNQQGKAQTDSTKNTAVNAANTGPFDLARLSLNEILPDLMAAQSVEAEQKDTLDTTIWGFEVFRSSNARVLRFEDTDLSGATEDKKNYVLFHDDEKTGQLAGYQLKLYSQSQTDALIGLLDKAGTLVFKQTKVLKGAIELDENGDEVKAGKSERETFRVWENKSSGLTYFLTENGSGQNLSTELIVLKRSTQFGKDWISTLQLDWYKNEKSEAL
jgi:hypothetical protein